jgi:photosystem II stability/assembly factor-like uncharacterized protein
MECVANATIKRTGPGMGKLDDHSTHRSLRMTLRYAVFVVVVATCAGLPHASARTNDPIDLNGVHAAAGAFSVAHFDAPAGTAAWSPLGPPGGDVSVVAASPSQANVVLAGTAPGGGFGGSLYRSVDGGAHWVIVPSLAGTSVHDLAFSSDGRAYAATHDSVWTSDDNGATWTHRDLGIDPLNDATFRIVVDPSAPATVWVGVTSAAGFQSVNLMRSTNRGATWQNRTPPLATPMIGNAIAIDPGNSSTVIAGFRGDFNGGAVWVTSDGGDNWQDRSSGLPGTPVNALNHDGTRLLAGGGMNFGSQDFGLYVSNDLGLNWTPLHDASWPMLIVTAIAVDPNDAQTIVVATDGAGINRSSNGGTSWDIGIGDTSALAAQSVRYAPANAQQLFVGANSLGVFASADGGATFAASSNGISELNLVSIAASPLDPANLAAAFQGNNNGGVLSSHDGGSTWSQESLPPTRYSKVGFSPDGTLYAISSGPSTVAPEGLYRREPDGHWSGLGPDQGSLYESDLAALQFSDVDPNLILLGGADFGVAGNAGTVWRSTDAGQSWVKQYAGEGGTFIDDIEIVADGSDQTMIASYTGKDTPDQGGVLRSVDGGEVWEPAFTLPTYMQFARMCASPLDPQVFFLAAATGFSNGGVMRSDDGGASWQSTGWTGAPIVDIACDSSDSRTLYLAQSGGARVARSTDGGVSFTPFDTGLANAGAPSELALARVGGDAHLLMATNKGSYSTALAVGDAIFANGFDTATR